MTARFDPEPDENLFDGDGVPCGHGESRGWYEHIMACPEDDSLYLFFDSDGTIRLHAATDHDQTSLRDRLIEAARDYVAKAGRNYQLDIGMNHDQKVGQDSYLEAGRDVLVQAVRNYAITAERLLANSDVLTENMDEGNLAWLETYEGKSYFNIASFIRWVVSLNIEGRLHALESL